MGCCFLFNCNGWAKFISRSDFGRIVLLEKILYVGGEVFCKVVVGCDE